MHWSLNVPFIATIAVGCIIQPCNGQRKSNRRNVRVWNSHVIMAIHSCKIFGGSLLQLYCNLYAATSTFLLCLMYREPNTPHNINLYAQLLTANLQTGLDFMCILCIRNIFFRWRWWLIPMPFSAVIFIYDETRKYLMRHRPGGWIENETYY